MRPVSKWIISLTGLIVLVTGGLAILLAFDIPGVTSTLNHWLLINPQVTRWVLLVLNTITALTGGILLLIGIFKRKRLRVLRYQKNHGEIRLPIAAMEHDLQYRLAENGRLDHPHVSLTVRRHKQADVKVSALTTDPDYQQVGQEALQVVTDYLQKSLGLTLRHPRIEVRPATPDTHPARVV